MCAAGVRLRSTSPGIPAVPFRLACAAWWLLECLGVVECTVAETFETVEFFAVPVAIREFYR